MHRSLLLLHTSLATVCSCPDEEHKQQTTAILVQLQSEHAASLCRHKLRAHVDISDVSDELQVWARFGSGQFPDDSEQSHLTHAAKASTALS